MELRKCLLVGALISAVISFENVTSSKILVIAFFSTKSHKMTYMHLVEELAKRGHEITVVTPIKPSKEIKNIKEVYTMDLDGILNQHKFNPFEAKAKEEIINPSQIIGMMLDICSKSLDLPQVLNLQREKFDLIFFQPNFNDCILALAYRIKAPMVLFTPTGAPSFLTEKIGGHFPVSTDPNFMLGYDSEMNFFQRLANFGVDSILRLLMIYIYEPAVEKIYREKLGQDIPSLNELYANASLILSNTHFSLTGPKPYLPDVVDVGGIHSRPAKPIPKDLEDFIKKGKEGFILFSMGSSIKGDRMPEEKRKMILNVFSKLKQQVLWKWESETMPDLPKNVKLSKWLPQQDLLGREDIKMFITHCGGGSTEESIYHGVPLVGIPMMADQPQNSRLAEKHGIAVLLNWNKIGDEEFMGAIQEVLNNPKYRDNAKKISAVFKDRPMDSLEVGVYWIEYILRHKGALHLRSASRKLTYFQYHSYDVILAYLIVIGTVLYVLYATIRLICRKIFCRGVKKEKISNHKKLN